MIDYYRILDLSRNATLTEIKKAYRQKALKYHPDKNSSPLAVEKFIEATEAYEVLSNPKKKQEYDIFYDTFIVAKELEIYQKEFYEEKNSKWRNEGEQKVKIYSSMSLSEFMDKVLDEGKFYTNWLGVLFMGGMIIFCYLIFIYAIFDVFSNKSPDGSQMLGILAGLGIGGYYVYQVVSHLPMQFRKEVKDRYK